MAGPRVGPKARPRTGSGLPTTSFLRPALQDVDGAPSHTMTCERQCAASADSFVSLRTPNPTASLILHDALLTDLPATGTSRQCVRQSPREADTQCCD
jgi:hypothetical protein